MTIENFSSLSTMVSGGFVTGILIGYAFKKVMKCGCNSWIIFNIIDLKYYEIATIGAWCASSFVNASSSFTLWTPMRESALNNSEMAIISCSLTPL
jgi:uncharacterized membrane protein (Fun14 family)